MPPLPSLLVFILSLLRETFDPSFFPILPVPKHGAPVGLFLPRDLPASFAAPPHPLALPDALPILVVHPVKLPWLIKCRAAVGAVADGFRSLWVLSRRMPSAFSSHVPSQMRSSLLSLVFLPLSKAYLIPPCIPPIEPLAGEQFDERRVTCFLYHFSHLYGLP